MERALRFEAFRNIGFEKENDELKPKSERFVLSNSLTKGEIGNLVILIGANNSGKSNVLEGLNIFGQNSISDRDITDLSFDESCRNPKLKLSSKLDAGEEYAVEIDRNKKTIVSFPEKEIEEKISLNITKENIFEELKDLYSEAQNCLDDNPFEEILESNFPEFFSDDYNDYEIDEKCTEEAGKFTDEQILTVAQKVFEQLKVIKANCSDAASYRRNSYTDFISQIENNVFYTDFLENSKEKDDAAHQLNSCYKSEFGYDFEGNIHYYTEEKFSNSSLKTDYKNIAASDFFIRVLNVIGVEVSTIQNAHTNFQKQNNKGVLTQLEKTLNKKLQKISQDFNKLYYLDDSPYSFSISLESDNVYFSIFRGEQSLSLDYQSAGFKWFLNLYFGLLYTTELNSGDIIIMDEPAMNIHPKGQKEVRAFLKDFAIRNDIIIVLATHSPFLIDLDYLDELRIVQNKDNITSIENNFSVVNENDPDSLLPVKDALTVENHIIMNPDNDLIFVEGITDYNYLTALKKVLGKDDIYFLPINGVGTTDKARKEVSERLLKIRKNNPTLLVDNDKAGQSMKDVNKDSDLKIISLDEVDANFKTIESLFSQEDLQKFNLADSKGNFNKHASTSALFKTKVIMDSTLLSDETKSNFNKLFERLSDN